VTGWVEYLIEAFGALGVALLMTLENLFPPIPSEFILPFAGFLVGRGELGFLPALVASTAGSLSGALILYALGRWGGRNLILRYGRFLRVKEADLDRAEGWFDKYDQWVVLFGRMVPGVRSVVSIPAGMLRMPFLQFVLLTTAGSAAWNALLLGAGWYLGENWQQIQGIVGSVSNFVLILVAVALVFAAIWWWRRRRSYRDAR
jgi:membrane protein DedA with SNARE-associated domain